MPDIMNYNNSMTGSVWIRPDGEKVLDRAVTAVFRLEFELDCKAVGAVINLSAADRYRLYVNGTSLICGPRKGDRFNHYYETVDISGMLKTGFNAITVRVTSYPAASVSSSQWGPLSVRTIGFGPMLVLSGNAELEDNRCIELSTGKADWTAALDDSFELDNSSGWCVIQTERFYGNRYMGWRDNVPLSMPRAVYAFNAGVGAHGEVNPLPLRPRMIPNMFERHGEFYRIIEGKSTMRFTDKTAVIFPKETAVAELDAGALTTAYFRLKSQGNGGKITVTYSERYFPKNDSISYTEMWRDDWENGVIYGHRDEIYPDSTETVFENTWFRTFRFVRIEATAGSEPLIIEMPDFVETGYPLGIKAGFEFGDISMEKLWDMSLLTLQRCMHETYEDCPYYEQMQYEQDTRLQALFTYAVSGDTRLSANALWDFHCSRLPNGLLQSRYPSPEIQVIPGFSLYWIFMLEEYIIQSGDVKCLKIYMPTVSGILDYFDAHLNPDGLAENLGYWEFGDWVDEWELGVPQAVKHGACALHNLNYSLALQIAARLAELMGSYGSAEDYKKRSESINSAVIRLCYDSEHELIKEGKNLKQFSQHTQALAVLCGALSGDKAKQAMRKSLLNTSDGILKCSFPWHYTIFRALEKIGLYKELSPIIWEQYTSILKRNLTTMPEGKNYERSDCHAWSASPLYEYTRMILGVKPVGIGWEKIEICPQAVGISKISGKVPTPKGEVFVEWRIEDGVMHIKVKAPNVPLTVVVNGQRYTADNGSFEV